MNAKRATFDLLDGYPDNRGFSAVGLRDKVADLIDRPGIFPDTILRYLREYRAVRNIEVSNINKKKSMYMKRGI